MDEKIALNLGCGETKIQFEGYKTFNVDIRKNKEVNPDIVCSIIDKLPFKDESVDLIFSSHVFEHIGRNEIYDVLKEWRRILKINGIMTMIVPDLEIAAIELLSGTTIPATWDILYGAQNYAENFHKSGYTNIALKALIEKYGFKTTSIECKNREIHCRAIRTDLKFDG